MPLANSNIYTKKSFKNIVFYSVFTMFSAENTVIYTFSAQSRSKTLVFAVFSMLWHQKTFQNIAIYGVFSVLFVFPLPEAYQNDPKFHFNTLLSSESRKHHLILVSVRNRFSAPPPPAKADIATAIILTNVIEHLVWLNSPQ